MIKQTFIFLTFIVIVNSIHSQIDSDSVMGIPVANNDTEMNNISGATEGSILYNMTQKNIYFFDGSNWNPVNEVNISLGQIKYSVLTTDHSGWYILNGRATSSLPTLAETNATTLGFTTNIPNSENRTLKHPSSTENINDTGGLSNTTLSQSNLPNINFTGTTSDDGNHNHNFNRALGADQIRNGADANRTFYNQGGTTNTSTSGNHSHTFSVNTGGSSQSFERYQPYLVVNTFIYLGL